jgi:hypothetical protein
MVIAASRTLDPLQSSSYRNNLSQESLANDGFGFRRKLKGFDF